jgi:hypothetical protein
VNYTVELYKARSVFGKRRDYVEKGIEKHDKEIKELLERFKREGGSSPDRASSVVGVDSRPNGRKVYFTTLGFGPGGAVQTVFTTIGDYDLALTQVVDFEDDLPEKKKVKNPAIPNKRPLEAFRQLEQYIPHLLENQ